MPEFDPEDEDEIEEFELDPHPHDLEPTEPDLDRDGWNHSPSY